MFTIEKVNPEKAAKTLPHSANVFHEALADGGDYYHVSNPNGDYDISYQANQEWFTGRIPAYMGKLLPNYRIYDEYDAESLDIITFKDYEQIFCTQATEYSIAIARIALQNTELPVYFLDPRAAWFLAPHERLFIGQKPAESKLTLLIVAGCGLGFVRGVDELKSDAPMSDIFVFNSLFWVQHILKGRKMKEVKYMEFPFARSSMGIGGMLVQTRQSALMAEQLGWRLVYNGDTLGKFRMKDLAKFYKLDLSCPDSTPENTFVVENSHRLGVIRRTFELSAALDDSILQDRFRRELAEYEEAIFSGHRTLGLLMRGTDYISSGMAASIRPQGTVEEMLPLVCEWMETGNYDRVFLATEDQDILNKMREALGNKLIAVSQERHSVHEFEEHQVINELEKQLYTKEEYHDRVIENTISYFYALHILSNCQAFLCSGQNNGWDTVCAMNNGRFERCDRMRLVPVLSPRRSQNASSTD